MVRAPLRRLRAAAMLAGMSDTLYVQLAEDVRQAEASAAG
jgi:hypothetical protein